MAEPSRDRSQPNPRVLAIMDAARAGFEHHGFHAASMASIAAEAGISVGHIYRYFENKEAVVAAIVAQDLEEIGQDLSNLTGGPSEMAAQILDQVRGARGRRMILWLEVRAEGARNPKVAAMIRDAEALIRRQVRATVLSAWKRGGVPGASAEAEIEVRVSLIGVLIEGLQLRAFHEGAPPSPALVEQVSEILARVLSPRPIFTGPAGKSPYDRPVAD